jgi:hypothetical protein
LEDDHHQVMSFQQGIYRYNRLVSLTFHGLKA